MITPLLLLALGALAALWYVWRRRRRHSQSRQQLEDALKHLFELEYRGGFGTISSLAGSLRLPDRAIVALAGRMSTQGLVVTRGQHFALTPQGQRLAMQIVRAHRL